MQINIINMHKILYRKCLVSMLLHYYCFSNQYYSLPLNLLFNNLMHFKSMYLFKTVLFIYFIFTVLLLHSLANPFLVILFYIIIFIYTQIRFC